MDAECQKCGNVYAVRENHEPTPLCDICAHEMVECLGKALADQDSQWGLYGNESKKALAEFVEIKFKFEASKYEHSDE